LRLRGAWSSVSWPAGCFDRERDDHRPFEPAGWKLAGQVVPVAYIVWSLWLLTLGVAFLV
jgi:hypothetical protein